MGKKLKKISPRIAVKKKSEDDLTDLLDKSIEANEKGSEINMNAGSESIPDDPGEISQLIENEMSILPAFSDYIVNATNSAPEDEVRNSDEYHKELETNLTKIKEDEFQMATTKEEKLADNQDLFKIKDNDQLFTYARRNMQFGIKVKHVSEIIRDFGNINELNLMLPGCIGSIIHRNKLIPVFESTTLIEKTPGNNVAVENDDPLLVLVVIEGKHICFTMDHHIELISGREEDAEVKRYAKADDQNPYIKKTLGYKESNLFIVNLEEICKDLHTYMPTQDVIDAMVFEKDHQTKVFGTSEQNFIYCRINNFNFVVEISNVVEIIEGYAVTELYGSNDFVRGLINLRGQVICCLDISSQLGCAKFILDERNKYIVLKNGQHDFALCVDEVIGMRKLDKNNFLTASSILGPDISKFFSHVIEEGDHTVLLLSTDNIVNSDYLNCYKIANKD